MAQEKATKLSPSEVQETVRQCDSDIKGGCFNTYTPYRSPDGARYCISHRDEAAEADDE